MGLLSNLLGKVLGNNLTDAINQIKNAAANNGAPVSGQTPSRTTATQRVTPQYTAPVREKSDAEWRAYFRDIIQAECYSYGIREDVPVTQLAGHASDYFKLYRTRPNQVYKAEWGQPYTFVLYQGETPKAVVMLGKGHSHYSGVKYLIARMYAKKLGLPYINFYTQMPNERGYVISRLRRFLH